jgi:Mor family transcriptional regulator
MKINGRHNINYMDLPMNLIIEEYNNGAGLRQLAKKYNTSHETIRKRLIKSGADMKPKGMPKGIYLKPVDEKKLLEIYTKSHSVVEASEVLGVSHTKIYDTLKDLNIELIRPDEINLPIDNIVRDYNLGLTQYELAEKYNVSPMTINRRLKKHNISARNVGPRSVEQKIKAKKEVEYIEKFEKEFDKKYKESTLTLIHDFISSYSKDKKEFLNDLRQFLNNLD